MKQKSKYDLEIASFREQFHTFKDKKISIYGIGRRTATLLEGIRDYDIVGLLDRDESNIGKVISNIKVISMEMAQQLADMIIINSDPSNYEVIYRRIQDSEIPVYYSNGQKAYLEDEDTDYEQNEYWNTDLQSLEKAIESHDVISFDFFDTLIMRKVITPPDVFRIVEKKIHRMGLDIDFLTLRQQAVAQITNREASLDDIYDVMGKNATLSKEDMSWIRQMELETENELCIARETVMEALRKAQQMQKEVYIVSDMYLPKEFYLTILKRYHIDFLEDHILLSWEQNASKKDGSLWEIFKSRCGAEKKILHIGDSKEADIAMAQCYEIDTFYVMSGVDMLRNSSVKDLLIKAVTPTDSCLLGLVVAKVFNDPFALTATKGKLSIEDCYTFGYCVYGAVLSCFLLWIYEKQKECQYDRLLFFSRDGYFLIKDYEYLMRLLDETDFNLQYVAISRRIAYLANISDDKSYEEYVKFPYVGTFREYVQSRFNLEINDIHSDEMINAATQYQTLIAWLLPYQEQIRNEIKQEKLWYRNYLSKNNLMDPIIKDATVDMGFYGTNQYYYQKLVSKRTDGLYVMAYLNEDNEYLKECRMEACFNDRSDSKAEKCDVKKSGSFLESFLTAPYGMIRYVDENGMYSCESDKMNQHMFDKKEQTNDGAMEYLRDYLQICGCDEKISASYSGYLFYYLLSGKALISQNVLDGYYFDNDMVGKGEVKM